MGRLWDITLPPSRRARDLTEIWSVMFKICISWRGGSRLLRIPSTSLRSPAEIRDPGASEEREERRKRRPHVRTVHSLDGHCERCRRMIRYCDISLEWPFYALSFAVNIVGHTKFQFFGFFSFMSLVGEFGFRVVFLLNLTFSAS